MHKTTLLFTLLATLLTFTGMAHAAPQPDEGRDSLARHSSRQLLDSGRRHFEQHEPGKALACFTTVAQRYTDAMDDDDAQLCIRAINNCACVYKYFYFDYAQAYEYFSRAYDLCESRHYDEFLPVILVNLGDLLNDYGVNYGSQALSERARTIFEQCMQRAVENRNWELMVTAFFNLANQNFDIDLQRYDVILSSDIPDDTPDLQYVRLQYDGIGHFQQHDYAAARRSFAQQLGAINTKWGPERDTISTYLNMARTYLAEQRTDSAVSCLLLALAVSDKHDIADHAAAICGQLNNLYTDMGDTAQAAHYHLRYLETKDEANANRLASIGEMTYIRELQREEQKAQQMAQRHRQQQLMLTVGIAALLLFMVLALLLWRKNRQLMMAYRTLYEKNQQVIRAEANEHQLRREVEEKLRAASNNNTTAEEKYSRSSLSDQQRQTLDFRIQDLLSAPDVICQQDLTLGKLAKMAESNTTYVSQVINEKYNQTFSTLLGSLRVREACRRMGDAKHYANVTIEGIAMEVGFKSRSAFFNAFKRETGLTPGEYQRLASKTE